MRRATSLVLALATVLAGTACGNWSNQDLVFLAALPDRTQLSSKLAGTQVASSSSGLQQALLGDVADGYTFSQDASKAFNGGLYATLDLLEHVRTVPPTTRHTDERIWGPFRDPASLTHFVQVVIDRTGCSLGADGVRRCATYSYHLDLRQGQTGPWATYLSGTWQVTGTVREGQGTLALDADAARSVGIDPVSLQKIANISVTYQTAPFPIQVAMTVSGTGGTVIDYAYRELATGSGGMHFHTQANVIAGAAVEDVDIRAGWRPDSVGTATLVISGGDAGSGATKVECWDTAGRLTYDTESWSGNVEGDPKACPTAVPTFP